VIFIFGTKGYTTMLAMATFVCRSCGNPAAQRIEQHVTKFTLFFIPLFTVSTRYSVQCAMCGATSGLDRAEAERLAATPGDKRPRSDRNALPGKGESYPAG